MKSKYATYALLLLAEIIMAFICGPHSCEWGNTVYFYFGVASLTAAFIMSFFFHNGTWAVRTGYGFLFLLASVVVWCVGFMLAGFKILCRLF